MAITITNPAEAKAFLYCLLGKGWRVKGFESDEYGYHVLVTMGGGKFVMALSPNAEQAHAFADVTWRKATAEPQKRHFRKLVVSPQPHAFWDRYLAQDDAGQQPFLGLKGPLVVGNCLLTFAAPTPSGRVTEAIRETVDILSHPKLENLFEGELAAQRPGKLGPWAVAVGMLLLALTILTSLEPGTMSTTQVVGALAVVLLGAQALNRKWINSTYRVLLLWAIAWPIVVNLSHSYVSTGKVAVMIVGEAISLALLILVPIRAKDFGYARRGEFFRALF